MPAYKHSNGYTYTPYEVAEQADSAGMSLDDFIKEKGFVEVDTIIDPTLDDFNYKKESDHIHKRIWNQFQWENNNEITFKNLVNSGQSLFVDIMDKVWKTMPKKGPVNGILKDILGDEFDPTTTADKFVYVMENIFEGNLYDEDPVERAKKRRKFELGMQKIINKTVEVDYSERFIGDQMKIIDDRNKLRISDENAQFYGGNFEDKVVAAAQAINGMATTVVPALFTGGYSIAPQIMLPMYSDYNIAKAKYKYGENNPDAFRLLAENNEVDIATPALLGYAAYKLEKMGIDGIQNYIFKSSFQPNRFVNLLKVGFENGLQESFQGLLNKVNIEKATGKSNVDAVKNVMEDTLTSDDFLEDFTMGMVGGTSMAGASGVVRSGARRLLDKALKSDPTSRKIINDYIDKISYLTDESVSTKDPGYKEKVEKKREELKEEFKEFVKSKNKLADYLTEEQKNELLDILSASDTYKKEVEALRKKFNKGDLTEQEFKYLYNELSENQALRDTRLNEIKKDANRIQIEKDLTTVRKAIKKITGLNIYQVSDTAEFLKELNKRRKAKGKREYTLEEIQDVDGTIIGKDILINMDVAADAGAITVGSHELLHAVLRSVINGDDGKITDEGRKLVKQFREELSDSELDAIEERLEDKYGLKRDADGNIDESNFDKYAEEYFNAYVDAAINNDFNDSQVMKLAKYFHGIFKKQAKFNGEFKNGKDMKAFLKQYISDVRKGEISDVFVELAQKGTGVDTEATSRSKAVEAVNKTETELKQKLKEEGKDYTKEEFQKSSAFNSIFSSINLDGGAINSYIKSLGMSAAKTAKVIEEAGKRLLNYNPQAERKTKDGQEITIGESIMANIGFAKKVAAKKLFEEGKDRKRTRTIEEKDADIEDTPTPTTAETGKKDVKLRKLKKFDVDLSNPEFISALTITTVNDLLNDLNTGKITFEQAVVRIDKLVLKDIRAELSKIIPKIAKNKKTGKVEPTAEYDAFIRNQYDEVVASLGIKTIRKAYKPWFKQEKTGKKDYRNIDPETGKVSNYVKDTQINTTNKREYIRWFLEGKPGDLTERRTALIRRIAKRKASLAVDNYIERNSNNIEAVLKAKMRLMSDSAENATNEQVSFDSVRFSKTLRKRFDSINQDMENDGFYMSPTGVRMTFATKKNGKWDKGRVFEQAFIETFQTMSEQMEGLNVAVEVAGEEGGVADAIIQWFGKTENHEVKLNLSAFMGSTLFSSFDVNTGKYTLANKTHADIKGLDTFVKKVAKAMRQKAKLINKEIDAWNEKNGYKKGDAEFAEQITGNITKGKQEYIPKEVYDNIDGKELGSLPLDEQVVMNHYLNKKVIVKIDGKKEKVDAPVTSITIHGLGTFRLSNKSIFKGFPMLKAKTQAYTSIRTTNTIKKGNQEFRDIKVGMQFKLAEVLNKQNGSMYNLQDLQKGLGISSTKQINDAKVLDKAIRKSRSNQFSKTSKGITILDFDDTLATTNSKIMFVAPDGTKGELNAEEYARDYQDLLEMGYKFDFSQFNEVVGGKTAPLFNKALKLQDKFGPKNMFVLTARPAEAAPAIHAFLKANGLNIPLKNITGLANSTSEAKALWIADKVGEGYNDFYFADDALQNVQAVGNMLEQFDVKRKVQQAKVKFSKTMSNDFNNILEEVTGIDSVKRFARTKARKRGASKGKFRLFIPPSHEDFVGLLYNFMGKGKLGDAHRDFFEQALIRPLNRAYREIDTVKQAIANDFKALNKYFPNVKKVLNKKTPDGDFTYQDAIRIYLWNKNGYEVPGLSPVDLASLIELVEQNEDLLSYADYVQEISRQENYVPPSDGWEAGNIKTDLIDATGKVGRAQYLQEFLENADIIFSEENLNKIEAAYGASFRSALEDMLHRIKTGVNRPKGQSGTINKWMNFLNGSVGTVMFFNVRSAILQQMSIVNYINFADNNIFAAAKAFANQVQYWQDFAFIFNSDMLKQRRGGIGTDINGNELAEAVSKSTKPIATVISKLLQLGFLPTQIGDNIAIAIGGATFYRNRINKYLKEGLSQKEAETKAFTDFQDITQSTQQSARPDMTSQQQSMWIGKLVLNFQNITSQYNRLIKKAASDIYNKRISPPYTTRTQSNLGNISKILYYGAIQNVIFYSLQTALFAVMFGDDDDEEQSKAEQFLKKKERVLNGTIDSILRGSGIYGVAASTVKNMAIKWFEQREAKGFAKDESAVLMEALNFSPVVGIKARKIVNAEKTVNYNENVISEMQTFDADNPQWSAVTNYIEAFTNFPANRLYQKSINMRNALDNDYTAWQRFLFFSGYTTWSLGLGDTEKMKDVKEKIKKDKKKGKSKSKSKSRKVKR